MNATRVTATVFGIMTGVYGLEHSYFEMIQGNIAPSGIAINAASPPCLPYPLGCEPVMTFIPNYSATGILAMIVGAAVMV